MGRVPCVAPIPSSRTPRLEGTGSRGAPGAAGLVAGESWPLELHVGRRFARANRPTSAGIHVGNVAGVPGFRCWDLLKPPSLDRASLARSLFPLLSVQLSQPVSDLELVLNGLPPDEQGRLSGPVVRSAAGEPQGKGAELLATSRHAGNASKIQPICRRLDLLMASHLLNDGPGGVCRRGGALAEALADSAHQSNGPVSSAVCRVSATDG